jgi:hypothetical protein
VRRKKKRIASSLIHVTMIFHKLLHQFFFRVANDLWCPVGQRRHSGSSAKAMRTWFSSTLQSSSCFPWKFRTLIPASNLGEKIESLTVCVFLCARVLNAVAIHTFFRFLRINNGRKSHHKKLFSMFLGFQRNFKIYKLLYALVWNWKPEWPSNSIKVCWHFHWW